MAGLEPASMILETIILTFELHPLLYLTLYFTLELRIPDRNTLPVYLLLITQDETLLQFIIRLITLKIQKKRQKKRTYNLYKKR